MNRTVIASLVTMLALSLGHGAGAASPEDPVQQDWMKDPMMRYVSQGGMRVLLSDSHTAEEVARRAALPPPRLAPRAAPAASSLLRGGFPPRIIPETRRDMHVNDIGLDLAQLTSNPTGPATTQSETNIAVYGPNIVVCFNDSATAYSSRVSFAGYSTSNDGGRTWRDGGGLQTAPNTVHLGDPGIAVDRHGTFYYATIMQDFTIPGPTGRGRATIGIAKSTDGGRTFAVPVDVYPASPPVDSVPGPNNERTTSISDKELIAVDNSGGPRDGTIYVAWNQYASSQFPTGMRQVHSQIVMVKSSDGGATWTDLVPVSDPHLYTAIGQYASGSFVSGAVLMVGPNGEVYCAWQESPTDTPTGLIKIARSDDGATFALQNQTVASLNSTGNPVTGVLNGGFRINEFPGLAIDPRNGTVYVCYPSAPTPWPGDITKPFGADRSDVYLTRSTDKGQTWSAPQRVNDDTTQNDQYFPSVAVTPFGVVGVMFYDRRNDPYNLASDMYMAQSRDGVNFGRNIRVSSASSPVVQTSPNFDPNIADYYMGDYNRMAADATSFYLAWGDNRDILTSPADGPRPDPNAYFAAVPVRTETNIRGL